jgi:DNA polymerase III delta prime subunit
MNVHKDIVRRINGFADSNKIPNILMHGPSGSGKRTILSDFIRYIYKNNKSKIAEHVRYVECSQGKGIKFIREELKFFAKTNVYNEDGISCKCVVLLNADKLTVDAQSALRRCLELFTHTTRFFMVVQNKSGLLRPILSRFCIIYIPIPILDQKLTNLITMSLDKSFKSKGKSQVGYSKYKQAQLKGFTDALNKVSGGINYKSIFTTANQLYEKGFSGLDLIEYVKENLKTETDYTILLALHKMKPEVRNENLFIAFGLQCLFLRSDKALENMGSL